MCIFYQFIIIASLDKFRSISKFRSTYVANIDLYYVMSMVANIIRCNACVDWASISQSHALLSISFLKREFENNLNELSVVKVSQRYISIQPANLQIITKAK